MQSIRPRQGIGASRVVGALVAAVVATAACSAAPRASDTTEAPTLVVMLVVDQLAMDLMARYQDLYSGGLQRLVQDGFSFEQTTHDHANTYTAPGHVTLSTGVHPNRHGVVGNEWFVSEGGDWRAVYALEQLGSPLLGLPDRPGRGPENIQRTGLADWVLAAEPRARVVSVSAKDRAAIGLAATAPGHVYWLERYAGLFVTAEHYRTELPEWVVDFNERELPALYSDTLWTSIVPEAAKSRSRPDTLRFELDGEHTAFPHRPSDRVDPTDSAAVNNWRWTYSPFTDHAVLAFTERAMRELELGRQGHLDFLAVAFSATDLVGHYYGPGSREQLDNLLRLDGDMGRLFDALDEQVGEDGWVLAMSADHGVLDIPELLQEEGVDAERLTRVHRADMLAALEGARFQSGTSREAAKQAVLDLPFVAEAYTFDEIVDGEPADSFAVLYRNSHSDDRIVHLEGRSGVHARMRPNRLEWGAPVASHGSPYYYDRHVPLVFLGRGVRAGRSAERAATVDVAPTLARLAGVPAPDDLDGRVLEAALAR